MLPEITFFPVASRKNGELHDCESAQFPNRTCGRRTGERWPETARIPSCGNFPCTVLGRNGAELYGSRASGRRPLGMSGKPGSRGASASGEPTHPTNTLAADVRSEQWTEPGPQHPCRLAANVDAALEQQVLDVPQRQREPHTHHHDKPDHLGRRVETTERGTGLRQRFAAHPGLRSLHDGTCQVRLTEPMPRIRDLCLHR